MNSKRTLCFVFLFRGSFWQPLNEMLYLQHKRAGFHSSTSIELTMSVSGNVQTVVKSIGVPDVRVDSWVSCDRIALMMIYAGNLMRKRTLSRPLERMESF